MRILVINKQPKSSYTACIFQLLDAIGNQHHFATTFADNIKSLLVTADNSIVFLTQASASAIGKWLQQQKLKGVIKNNKIDLLIQNASSAITQKKIPQLLVVDDIEKLPAVKKISYSRIFLLTYSQYAKQALADKGFTNIVHVIPFFADALYQPITWSMKQQVKIDYTEGREYFYTSHHFKSIDEILNFLKAFSGFKKWQQSSMKLVITGNLYVPPGDWEEKLNTYKYREDVLILNKQPEAETARLLAGAYACIHLPSKDGDVLPLLQAMQCNTPVISFETETVKEYAAEAALIITRYNYDELAQKMMLMYKDELMRNTLIENCAVRAAKYSRESAIEALQNIVL